MNTNNPNNDRFKDIDHSKGHRYQYELKNESKQIDLKIKYWSTRESELQFAPEQNNQIMKAALHNISIVSSGIAFSKLDELDYNIERQ